MAKVTITFDNGPEPPITHHVLDVLARHGIKTSFYVIGRKLESGEGRAAVARAKAEGHWIGNHSYSHSVSLGASDDPVTSKRSSTAVATLLTFWPPGPDERTKRSSSSCSSTATVSDSLTRAIPSR